MHDETKACQSLWRTVLNHNVSDALGIFHSTPCADLPQEYSMLYERHVINLKPLPARHTRPGRDCRKARVWIYSKDFLAIVEMAGYDTYFARHCIAYVEEAIKYEKKLHDAIKFKQLMRDKARKVMFEEREDGISPPTRKQA